MSDGDPSEGRVERWIKVGTEIITPTTLLAVLLFYFGYVSSQAQYSYFGVDVDTIGLSTQDYIMRSPQPLLVPLLVLPLAAAGLLVLDRAIVGRMFRAPADEDGIARAQTRLRSMIRRLVILGLAVATAGVVLIIIYGYVINWPPYGIVTPMALASGAGLTAYAAHLQRYVSTAVPDTSADQREIGRVPRVTVGSVKRQS